MLFGTGPEGVKLNLLHFQPVELIKLLLVFFLAGYLAERGSLIADKSGKENRNQKTEHRTGELACSPESKIQNPKSG